MGTLRERTLGINAVYPDAPLSDSEFWLCGEGSYGAWRRFSTSWTGLLIEQIRPKAVLLLGRKAALAMRYKLAGRAGRRGHALRDGDRRARRFGL